MIKRGIFKATTFAESPKAQTRSGTRPERTPSGPLRLMCSTSSGAGALVVGRDMRSADHDGGCVHRWRAGRGVEVIDIGLSSTDQLWFASGYRSSRHVHREPQSRGIQRDQVLSGGREADHLSQPR